MRKQQQKENHHRCYLILGSIGDYARFRCPLHIPPRSSCIRLQQPMASQHVHDLNLGIDTCSKLQPNSSPSSSDESNSAWCLYDCSGFPCWSHLKPIPGWRSCLRYWINMRHCIRLGNLCNNHEVGFHNVIRLNFLWYWAETTYLIQSFLITGREEWCCRWSWLCQSEA